MRVQPVIVNLIIRFYVFNKIISQSIQFYYSNSVPKYVKQKMSMSQNESNIILYNVLTV